METLNYQGKVLILTQKAFVTDTDKNTYRASAVDSEGNEYIVFWSAIDYELSEGEFVNNGDECNWEAPDSVVLV